MKPPSGIHLACILAAASLPTAALAGVLSEGAPTLRVQQVAPPRARPFSLHDVRLLDGPFKDGESIAIKYLLSLEPDRFLANFQKESGLQPKAQHYGGWESQGVSGHSLGHYLSGCALAYASTGDRRLLDRVNDIVDELAECQKAQGDGYVAAIPGGKKAYAEVAAGNIRSAGFDLNGIWVPNYTMHKVFAGLRDAYRQCGNPKALQVAKGLADWFEKTLSGLNEEQMQKVLAAEHGGMNETFADLYADTGDERYLKLSRRFHHQAILDPLARGEDILPGKHANTQIPKLIGLATRYELAGDPADRAAAQFFWDRVVHHHSYVTGGHCDAEHFGPPDKLNNRLSAATTETCNVYNMLKLTEHVFGWSLDPAAADFYERALLNHIRSTQRPDDGRVIYNLSLKPGHYKEYQSQYDGFTCCVGSGMENHVKYGNAIYFHSADDLWVNLFIASELKWKARGVTLRQETKWPDADTTTLTITCDQPETFALRLRHPFWADTLRVTVNGQLASDATSPSSYCVLRRQWKRGDKIEVQFPMSLRTECMPDNPNRLAVFFGPTLLAADLGPVDHPRAARPGFVPALVTEGRPVESWVKPVAATRAYGTDGVGRPRDVVLVPFFRLHDRRYTVYLDKFTSAEWTKREAEIRAEEERLRQLEARTVDLFKIGEMQPERDHNVRGEKTDAIEALGRKLRHAFDGGWFSFDMAVPASGPADLVITYWGSETGDRTFDVLVDNQKIATQSLHQDNPEKFWDKIYPLPAALIAGKSKVTVKFQAHPGNFAGGVFGVRVLKP